MVNGCTVVGGKSKQLVCGEFCNFAANQVTAGGADIANGHHIMAAEGSFYGHVPLFHQWEAEFRYEAEVQRRCNLPGPWTSESCHAEWAPVNQVSRQAET